MKVSNTRRNLLTLAAMILAATLLAVMNLRPRGDEALAAQTGAPAPAPGPAGPSADALHLLVGRSLLMTSPAGTIRISVADPAIVDVLVVSPNQILINGKSPGVASLMIWNETGQSQTFDAYVDTDVTEMVAKIRQLFPSEPVQVEARGGCRNTFGPGFLAGRGGPRACHRPSFVAPEGQRGQPLADTSPE